MAESDHEYPPTQLQQLAGSSTSLTQVGSDTVPPHLHAREFWQPGRQVGDFRLLSQLGQGGLGTVFLAKDLKLDRLVALKVADEDAGSVGEGHLLAGLEHEHIVTVYAAFGEKTTGKHCLCLQYIAGTNLGAVIQQLHGSGATPTTGEDLLNALDAVTTCDSRFDPAALRDRERLAESSFVVAVCRLGEQLAKALAFAHRRGILHCDIKPANILMTHYGRPKLVDFNVSVQSARNGQAMAVGGTASYMSPEQAAALRDGGATRVDERTDLYSLGVVLFELATGVRPTQETVLKLHDFPREFAWVIRRCLQANPADRYANATALATALAGVQSLLNARQRQPAAGRFGMFTIRRPLTVMLLLALAPHLVGSVLNITYNLVELQLNTEQQAAFDRVIVIYNLLVYPICTFIGVRLLCRYRHEWVTIQEGRASSEQLDTVRRDTANFARWAIRFSLYGWLPGGILFPLVVDCVAGPLPWTQYAHCLISFTLAGLVGMVYSYFGLQYVVLRGLYPYLGNPDEFSADTVRAELRFGNRWMSPFLLLATMVPLAGTVLLIILADGVMTLGFRILSTCLIGIGMFGVTLLMRINDELQALAKPWERIDQPM